MAAFNTCSMKRAKQYARAGKPFEAQQPAGQGGGELPAAPALSGGGFGTGKRNEGQLHAGCALSRTPNAPTIFMTVSKLGFPFFAIAL